MSAMAVMELIAAAPEIEALIVSLIHAIHHHPNPKAATVAATKAVVATPDDTDTNDPHSPYFVP